MASVAFRIAFLAVIVFGLCLVAAITILVSSIEFVLLLPFRIVRRGRATPDEDAP